VLTNVSLQSFQYFLNKNLRSISEVFRKVAGLKPTLTYLEIHLAEHCNLNCKGCSHFSPLAKQEFPSISSYKKDLKQLATFFSTIRVIALLGGEPLQNPQINELIENTRTYFPKAKIIIVTNGILIPKMPYAFWETCKANSIDFDITIYPPFKTKESLFTETVKKHELNASVHVVTSFQAFYNPKGDTNVQSAFKKCRKRWYTPMLKDGKIYVCPKPATIKYFNQAFNLSLPDSGFVDIYTPNLNGWKIKQFLNEPSSICSYCTLGWNDVPTFPWGSSKLDLIDWQATDQTS
jgi:organic radical activating enzyme